MNTSNKATYRNALNQALELMEMVDIEPTSALKEAASNHGISFGEEMGAFVNWAYQQKPFQSV